MAGRLIATVGAVLDPLVEGDYHSGSVTPLSRPSTDRPGAFAALLQALAVIDQGLACFPCCADKRPTTPHGYKDATCDRVVVQELWKRHPGHLIGVATGEISGLDVLDIDPRHGGDVWFAEHKHRLPSTRVHRTRSGGLHLLFRHQQGMRCSAGRIAAGVDVRADGGYVIWWPAAGLPVLSDMPMAAWPAWLCAQLTVASATKDSAHYSSGSICADAIGSVNRGRA